MGFSKKIMGKEVGDGNFYAKPHQNPEKAGRPMTYGEKMVGAKVGGPQPSTVAQFKVGNYKDPNTMTALEITTRTPVMRVSMGNPNADDVKTSGIEVRGSGAATKGRMARGPMG
jgi:hypothetical protein